ncbi:MAG: hypothetical protein IKC58_00965 [Clostridia bacterium]|nr:hypothetical protein [Clostridia bacterium]
MAFGDVLRSKIQILRSASENSRSDKAFWVLLRDIAIEDICDIYPKAIDSDIAIPIYYAILSENLDKIPKHFKTKLKSNGQERFRVILRNIFSSNALHPNGIGSSNLIEVQKEINETRNGYRVRFRRKNDVDN